jgi:hypothetical protein
VSAVRKASSAKVIVDLEKGEKGAARRFRNVASVPNLLMVVSFRHRRRRRATGGTGRVLPVRRKEGGAGISRLGYYIVVLGSLKKADWKKPQRNLGLLQTSILLRWV